ncbi:hypothetical protein LTR24_002217 [Lithohypha guttulata]|uniref:Uncharacterized protein n=1 Tax=Lithohypha guttulata TaxID=1690604 RepID=A0ABR0KIB3_9EURO|nr:hypothetical protein LTR24_002217 [Lithohypha guttulata]
MASSEKQVLSRPVGPEHNSSERPPKQRMTTSTRFDDSTMAGMRAVKGAFSAVKDKHESKVIDASSHLQKGGLERTTGGHIGDKCNLDAEDQGKAVDNKCTSCNSPQRESSENTSDGFVEKWDAKAFKPMKEVDNGRRLGEGFRTTWTLARSGENTLDLVEPDSDSEADDAESGDEAADYPY